MLSENPAPRLRLPSSHIRAIRGSKGLLIVAAILLCGSARSQQLVPWGWGHNSHGQLGARLKRNSETPKEVIGVSGVSAIASGAYHSMALLYDGQVWGWGSNFGDNVGDG